MSRLFLAACLLLVLPAGVLAFDVRPGFIVTVAEPTDGHEDDEDNHQSLTYRQGWDLALKTGKPLIVWTGKGLCKT